MAKILRQDNPIFRFAMFLEVFQALYVRNFDHCSKDVWLFCSLEDVVMGRMPLARTF